MTDDFAIAARDVVEALRARHPVDRGEWLFFTELRTGTGYGPGAEQRIDAYALGCWGSQERIAYEVKVNRSDWLRELKQPRKRALARRFSTSFFFAAPKGLIRAEEVPIDTGLVEVWREDGKLRSHTTVAGPHVDGYPPTWRFVASLLRSVEVAR
jgi:hypothetical protein